MILIDSCDCDTRRQKALPLSAFQRSELRERSISEIVVTKFQARVIEAWVAVEDQATHGTEACESEINALFEWDWFNLTPQSNWGLNMATFYSQYQASVDQDFIIGYGFQLYNFGAGFKWSFSARGSLHDTTDCWAVKSQQSYGLECVRTFFSRPVRNCLASYSVPDLPSFGGSFSTTEHADWIRANKTPIACATIEASAGIRSIPLPPTSEAKIAFGIDYTSPSGTHYPVLPPPTTCTPIF